MGDFEDRMAGLRLRFIDRAARDRGAVEAALAQEDRSSLRHLAHGLAGTAGIFGFAAIGQAAQQVEDLLDEDSPWTAISAAGGELVERLDQARNAG